MKKQNKILIGVFIVLVIGITSYLFNILPFSLVTENIFVNPDWARLECAPTDAEEGNLKRWLDQQTIFNCDAFTDKCSFFITNTKTSSLDVELGSMTPYYQICSLEGNSCGAKTALQLSKGETKSLPTIISGQSYVFSFGNLLNYNLKYTMIQQFWKPWKLYRFVGGSKSIVNSYNCDIISSARANILLKDLPSSQKLYMQGAEGTKWINYVNAWNYGPATNVFTHPTYGEVYCNAGHIYDIVELQLANNQLVKVNPSYTGTQESGDVIKGMGNDLGAVECCPNEPNCGDDFQYEESSEGKTCFTDVQCGGLKITDCTHYSRYKCVDSKCTEGTSETVECTATACCIQKPGTICDLSDTNYGKCITQTSTDYCGDNKCTFATENCNTCPKDCKSNPDGSLCVNCQERPNDPACKSEICKSCDAFALSTLLGSFWKEKQCTAKGITIDLNPLPQTTTTCWFSLLKYLLIPAVLIFVSLISYEYLQRFNSIKGEKNKITRLILSIILAGIVAYIVFISFYIGIIIAIMILILKMVNPLK